MRNPVHLALLFAPLLVAGVGAGVQIEAPVAVEWRFDPLEAVNPSETLAVRVERSERRDLVLVVEPDGAGPWRAVGPSGEEIALRLQADGRDGPAFPLSGDSLSFALSVVPGTFAPPGRYLLDARLRVEADGAPGDVLAERLVGVAVDVPASARAGFRGTQSGGRLGDLPTVDFGTVTGGDTRRIFIGLQSNSDVDLTLTSDNRGHLAHTEGVDAIPYTLSLEGSPYDLGAPVAVTMAAPSTPSGDLLSVDLTLSPDASERTAGQYRDVLSVEVEAR